MSKTLTRMSRTSPGPARSKASQMAPPLLATHGSPHPDLAIGGGCSIPAPAGAGTRSIDSQASTLLSGEQINGHPSPGRLRYRCPDCCNSTLLPFVGESPWHFTMTSAGGQRSAVGWKNHPSLHLWNCPRLKGKQ